MSIERWNIIAKYLNKEELNSEEKIYLETAVSDEVLQTDLNEATAALEKTDRYFQLKEIDTTSAWNKVNQQLGTRKKTIPFYQTLLRVAAVFVLITTTGIAAWQFSMKTGYTQFTTNETDLSRPQFVLADGSKIILSHGSTLKAPKKFNGNTREVELKGEAFFDVAKNAQKPFIIKTGKASIKVLGTSFNVNAYDTAPTVEVIVKTGRVQFFENSKAGNYNKNKIILLPGERGVYYKLEQKILKNTIESGNTLSWMTHEIRFDFAKLTEVVSTLQHIYNVEIKLGTSIDLNQKINATFNKQEIDYVLNVVALTLDLRVTKNTDNVYTLTIRK